MVASGRNPNFFPKMQRASLFAKKISLKIIKCDIMLGCHGSLDEIKPNDAFHMVVKFFPECQILGQQGDGKVRMSKTNVPSRN